jgi:HAMP domain-containing protein
VIKPPIGGARIEQVGGGGHRAGSPRTLTKQIPGGPGFIIVGPRLLLTPAVLDQYYVEFIRGSKSKPIIIGDADLRPDLPAHVHWLTARQHVATVPSGNGRAQLRLLSVKEGGGTLIVTTSLAGVSETVRRLELILIISSLGAVLLVGLGVALVLRRGMRPIETMAAQADKITAGDLTDRVSLDDDRTEVGRLGAALNGMLRPDRAFRAGTRSGPGTDQAVLR